MTTFKINTHQFPITETLGFNGTFNLPYKTNKLSRELTLHNVRKNPYSKGVLFGSLSKKDLEIVRDDFDGKKLTKAQIKHNEFAFYNHQIIK